MRAFMAILTTSAVIAAACGGGGGAATTSGAITITGAEFKFEPDTIRLKVGQEVRITFRNDGDKDHEMMMGKTVSMMAGKPGGFQTWLLVGVPVRFERDGKEIMAMDAMGGEMEMGTPDDAGMMLTMQGASPITMIFTVPDKVGEWEMGCFEDDGAHYDDGMKGKVIVER